MTPTPAARYAVYWAPQRDDPLWQAGCAWLGRDPLCLHSGTPPAHACAAWRYGFHATLVAPMRLGTGFTRQAWLDRLSNALAGHRPFVLPPLSVQALGGFVALRLTVAIDAMHPLRRLADDCVLACAAMQSAIGAAEVLRRERGLSNDLEREHLRRWGYPFVFETWRFHMTLSDAGLAADEALRKRAEQHFARALSTPPTIDSVVVFDEPEPGAPFRPTERLHLGPVDTLARDLGAPTAP